ncbi:PQQ-binding-like beta-propeller repeat protein [Candidatus Neomarinimicrobiota bacterium]
MVNNLSIHSELNRRVSILAVILALSPNLSAQNLPLSFHVEGKALVEHTIGIVLRHTGSYEITPDLLAVFGRNTEGAKTSEGCFLFSNDGSMLWNKNLYHITGVSLGEGSQKVIIKHNYDGVVATNSCYDLAGNLLWETTLPSPGITQSKDGKYGIIQHMGTGDSMGYLKIFDLDTGAELPIPFKSDYSGFQAQFLDAKRVAIVFQRSKMERNDVENTSDKESNLERNTRQRARTASWNIIRKPALFVIYEIPTNRILHQEELVDSVGTMLRKPPDAVGNIAILPNGSGIVLALRRGESRALMLVHKDKDGQKSWESDLDTERILGVQYIHNGYLLVTSQRKILDLLELATGRKIWSRQLSGKGSDVVLSAWQENGSLFLHMMDYWVKQAISYEIDILTGELLGQDPFTPGVIPLLSGDNTVLLDQNAKSVRIYQGK